MNDYFRRAGKFLFYLILVFAVVIFLIPAITGDKPDFSNGIFTKKNNIFFLMIFAYAFVYPVVAFINKKRYLNGTLSDNMDIIDRVFADLKYVKIQESPDLLVFRKISKFARFAQWYEDKIKIKPEEDNSIIISGPRKAVTRIDLMIDRQLIQKSEI